MNRIFFLLERFEIEGKLREESGNLYGKAFPALFRDVFSPLFVFSNFSPPHSQQFPKTNHNRAEKSFFAHRKSFVSSFCRSLVVASAFRFESGFDLFLIDSGGKGAKEKKDTKSSDK